MTPSCSHTNFTAVHNIVDDWSFASSTLKASSWRFQLNQDKMELIWFGSESKLTNRKQLKMSFKICCVIVEQRDSICTLVVILDSKLSMHQHVANCRQFAVLTSIACISSSGCSTRSPDDSFLHSSYHMVTSAMLCSLVFQLAWLHLFSIYLMLQRSSSSIYRCVPMSPTTCGHYAGCQSLIRFVTSTILW